MEIPKIASEWSVLFKPEGCGDYINDHTVFRTDNGWQLIGITGKSGGGPSRERYFADARGKSLLQPLTERGRAIDTGTLCWAPCVIRHEGLYFMYYGPSPTKMAVSTDATEWMGYEIKLNAPFLACHRDHFVLKTDEGWLMYAAGTTPGGLSCISCLESSDLVNWEFYGYALTASGEAPLRPAWGALESPYVVKREDVYYLFTTYTDSSDENYNDTLVFASENPRDFGVYSADGRGAVPLVKLFAHAPEVISCPEGDFITTCGWAEKPIPNPGCV
ncbi:MAG: hypothetical protein GX851_02930, partial [Clostridiales bacterium]|nr:hypothetical protein [Clostridiales bacterium]